MNLVDILNTFLTIYIVCVLLWALLSWLPMVLPELSSNSTVRSVQRFLDSVILPYMRLFRFIPPVRLGNMLLDVSSIVGILILFGIQKLLLSL